MSEITDIHCPQCGAPANFDIVRQAYLCSYCGGRVTIGAAIIEKQGFRSVRAEKLRGDLDRFRLFSAVCEGCGAEVVFEENEALANCAFCGRSMVQKEYLDSEGMPESVIPFAITLSEAQDRLREWCDKNRGRREARKLRPLITELKGFYLPYELTRGPVHLTVSRMDSGVCYECEGLLGDALVSRSKQLDNLLLDGMEPFDFDSMVDFDFAYVAGHRVKTGDVTSDELVARISAEAGAACAPSVRKTLETSAVSVSADANDAIGYPVLLPVYYICDGDMAAAVNGQTGKVSVRALKESHYYFLPWWLKALAATAALSGAVFGAMALFGMESRLALFTTALLAFFFFIVTLCVYSDTAKNKFAVESGRRIFTSGEKTFRRERGGLVMNEKILKRKVSEPVYFHDIGGVQKPVELRFTTPRRVIGMLTLALAVLFLPVIFALFANGFDFAAIKMGGSAVWFCIFVPVVPIFLLKFGVVEIHENPWIYYRTEKGRRKRYKKQRDKKFRIDKELVKNILMVVFVPPASLAVWFGIISFIVMVYLTAGYG